MFKFLVVAALAATLPTCALAKPNPLAADVRQTLFVKDVELAWSYDDAKLADDANYVAYKNDAKERLKTAVATAFASSPAGSEAVAFKIDVKTFSCASTGCSVKASVSVVQLSDGKELGVYTKVQGFQMASGGLLGVAIQAAVKPDVVGIMSANFAATLRGQFDKKDKKTDAKAAD
jgi:hypothetical protein